MIMHIYDYACTCTYAIIKHTCFSFSICYCSCKCSCNSLQYIMFPPSSSTTGFACYTLQERLVYLCGYLKSIVSIVIIIHCYREENASFLAGIFILRSEIQIPCTCWSYCGKDIIYNPQIRITLSLIQQTCYGKGI